MDSANELLVAMVGSFGSGCTFVADNYLVNAGFRKVTLSDILRSRFVATYKRHPASRSELQTYGTKLRHDKGPGYLAEEALPEILGSRHGLWVVDSVRNPGEIAVLRRAHPNVVVLGILASLETRWRRSSKRYEGNRQLFLADERIDRDEGVAYGQRVTDCILQADYVIDNEWDIDDPKHPSRNYLPDQVQRFVDLARNPGCWFPFMDEALMAVAYANGQRSRCLKRRVGAVVVGPNGVMLSSGYNSVPKGLEREACWVTGRCYRDDRKAAFAERIRQETALSAKKVAELEGLMWEEFKILDRCRALHAEEMAIVGLARYGSRLPEDVRMYVTTHPCNLCANKMVEVGIGEVVYFEPYPVPESVTILTRGGVARRQFSGVTFSGYFRLFGGMPNANVPQVRTSRPQGLSPRNR